MIQPGGTPGCVVAPEHRSRLAVAGRKIQKWLRRQIHSCAETPQCGRKLQRGAPHRLPERTGASQSMPFDCLGEKTVKIFANQAGRAGRCRATNAVLFEQDDGDTCRRQSPCAGDTGQPAAHDDHPGLKAAAKARERRAAPGRKAVEPVRHLPQFHATVPSIVSSGGGPGVILVKTCLL